MTIFTAGAPNIVIPAKAGIQFYCLNHSDGLPKKAKVEYDENLFPVRFQL